MTKRKKYQEKKKITDYKRFGSNLDAITYNAEKMCEHFGLRPRKPRYKEDSERFFGDKEDLYGSK